MEREIVINVDTTSLDKTIEKANRLVELLREAEQINEIPEKEILRKQLKLLAEESYNCTEEMLPSLTSAMCQVYGLLK